MKYSIIPNFDKLAETEQLIKQYYVNLEYNDFCNPDIYDNQYEIDRRIEAYKLIRRDGSDDTMHGAFLGVDIAAVDSVLCKRSRELCEQSLRIAERLGVKGVVFHTGLIGGLKLGYYVNHWLDETVDFWTAQCKRYPGLNVYMENSFEQEPDIFVRLMEKMKDVNNFMLCLDYGHAILSGTPIEIWVEKLAPYIGHMHLNDNDLNDDLHLVPGEGKIDFDIWYELVNKYSIDTSVLLEISGLEKAEKAVEYMRGKYGK